MFVVVLLITQVKSKCIVKDAFDTRVKASPLIKIFLLNHCLSSIFFTRKFGVVDKSLLRGVQGGGGSEQNDGFQTNDYLKHAGFNKNKTPRIITLPETHFKQLPTSHKPHHKDCKLTTHIFNTFCCHHCFTGW